MVVVDGEQAREQQIKTQQEQSRQRGQQDRRASRSSRGQRMRQAEQPAGVSEAVGDQGRCLIWDYKTKQNLTRILTFFV